MTFLTKKIEKSQFTATAWAILSFSFKKGTFEHTFCAKLLY